MMNVDCNNLTTAVWVYDIDQFCICWANDVALRFWEADTIEELKERNFQPKLSHAVHQTLLGYREAFKSGKTVSTFWQYSPKSINKETFCQMSPHTFSDGRIGLLCEATLAELVTANMSQNTMIMLSTYDLQGNLTSSNPPFKEQMSNNIQSLEQVFTNSKNISHLIRKLIDTDIAYSEDCLIETNQGKKWFNLQASISNEEKDNREILVQQFNIHERKIEELSLSLQANTDPLTGLLNRRGLNEELAKNIANNIDFFIFYIDLDSFKMINDSMGHAFGDHILKTLSNRLIKHFAENSKASRVGGDEFILLVYKNDEVSDQELITEKLLNIVNQSYLDDDDNQLQVSASIGCASYPKDGCDLEKLLLRADSAMYNAKSLGKKRCINYEAGMEDLLQRKNLLARYMLQAIKKQELVLNYQPILNVECNQIDSFEVLILWNNPTLGNVSTQEILQVAEETGMNYDLENWAISQCLKDLPELRLFTNVDVNVSINISASHFLEASFSTDVNQLLIEHNAKPADLIIELSESSLITAIKESNDGINNLINIGINLSIDNFGLGYSCLAYLHQIPANIVKIDESFLQKFEEKLSTLKSMHQLLSALSLKPLMQGVSTKSQSHTLNSIGIHLQQGAIHGLPEPLAFYKQAYDVNN